jgi:hypothetical protein
MPVRIFREQIGRKKEKDLATLADVINQFEKELDGGGMQIRNINFAAAISTVGEEIAYSIVHYGPMTSPG